MKDYLVTCKQITVKTCIISADSADEAEDMVKEDSNRWWGKEEVLANDYEAEEYKPERTGPVKCPECGSENVIAVDNQPLSTDRKGVEKVWAQRYLRITNL